jgi:ribose-phosphate pyrophosphokinase
MGARAISGRIAAVENGPELRAWLERLVEAKVKAALEAEREARFRETFALISVRPADPLAETLARLLDQRLVDVDIVTFGDGEKKPVVRENLSGKNVFVIATVGMSEDPDVSFANTCRLVSALRRTCKAGRITVVAPCLWYQAQDKTHARREPISVRDVADDITRRGMDHIMVVELHSEQIEIAFDSFDHLKVTPLFADYLSRRCQEYGERVVLISPDDGGVRTREELFKNMSAECTAGLASVHQLRVRGQVDAKEVLEFVGDVEGKVGVIFDDMLRSGTTMFQAAAEAKKRGAKRVVGAVAHFFGVSSRGKTFEEKLVESALDELIITNTRPDYFERAIDTPELRAKITLLDISPYLARAIRNYLTGGTVKDMIQRVPDRRELYQILHAAGAGSR